MPFEHLKPFIFPFHLPYGRIIVSYYLSGYQRATFVPDQRDGNAFFRR